jgi:hypothetical protein
LLWCQMNARTTTAHHGARIMKSRKLAVAAPAAAPAAPMSRAEVMAKLESRIADRIDDARRSIARTLVEKQAQIEALAKAMACTTDEERGGTLNGCLWNMDSIMNGPRSMHETAGELAAWLGIEAVCKESIKYGMTDEALIAELIATNLRDALEDSSLTGHNSTDAFSNAIANHKAEGKQRGRRTIHQTLVAIQAMMAKAI